MARVMSRAIPQPSIPTFSNAQFTFFSATQFWFNPLLKPSSISALWASTEFRNSGGFNGIKVFCGGGGGGGSRVREGERGYKGVWRVTNKKSEELELSVKVHIEEGLPNDPEILSIAEMVRLNAPMAIKLAFDGQKNLEYKTRDTAIDDVGEHETIELSLLLCNDEFIRKLNKDRRHEDRATDVLSMSHHISKHKLRTLMLGDIVISMETAARQAEARGHTLLDEIRILLVRGLLHLLGFDHELTEAAETEMEKEVELFLKNVGWEGKGLIKRACDAEYKGSLNVKDPDDRKKEGSLRFYRPKFKYIFSDMDGTLLNSKGQISSANANAIKEALSRGVQVVVATGKARGGAIDILKTVDLVGKDGIVSESSPGVFLQGLLVYGMQGREIFKKSLDHDICREAFSYSLEHKIPLVAFCGDRCLTLSDHPLVDSLHSLYHEPEAEIMPSVETILATAEVQKLAFLDTVENVATTLRPYWSEATGDRASVVQALADILEIVPPGTSKGNGVKLLLDHLGVSPDEIMAIGDGENDVEMLKLAGLGIALSNGSDKTKTVADVIGLGTDEDGVADAIYRYAF